MVRQCHGEGQRHRSGQQGQVRTVAYLNSLAIRGWSNRLWYHHAAIDITEVCRMTGWNKAEFIDILALTSPMTQVRRNIRVTMAYMRGDPLPKDVIRSTRAAVKHYEQTGKIRGPKTSQFALALKGRLDAVVLDTWMALALDCDTRYRPAAVRHEARRRIVAGARKMGLHNTQYQAAIWAGVIRREGRNVPRLSAVDELEARFMERT